MKLPELNEFSGTVIDEGNYTLKFEGYDGPKPGNFKDMVVFLKFSVQDDDEFDGVVLEQLYGFTSKKFLMAVTALQGGEYDEDGDLDDCIGVVVDATVSQAVKEKGTFNNIDKLVPSRRKRKAAPKKAAPEVEDDTFDDEGEPEQKAWVK